VIDAGQTEDISKTHSDRRTVLLVDDEVSFRDSVRPALQSAGYSVLEAANYDAALQTFRQHDSEVDLLITDISLPGNNGYELAAQVSAVRSDIKVIFVSGHAGIELCKFYSMTESDLRLLKKPFEPDELLQRVESALTSRGWQIGQANHG
jgi:DNA-binding NtrC family response regulator